MKKIVSSLIVVLALPTLAVAQGSAVQSRQAQAQQLQSHYKQAEKAYAAGDRAGTIAALRKAFKIDPKHGPSTALAIKLKGSGKSFKIKGRQRALASVTIPVVDFNELPLSEALQTLSTLVEENSKQTVTPNFVIQDKSDTLRDKKVTLNMKGIPASVVLDYLMNLASAKAKYGEYAITIRPVGGSVPKPSKPVSQQDDF